MANRILLSGTGLARPGAVASRASALSGLHPDRILLSTDLVTVGEFRCRVDHAMFRDSGPIRQACFVFPRTAVTIAHDGKRPFVADPALVTLYNAGQRYERTPISPDGDRCEWFGVAPALLRDAVRSFDPAAADAPLAMLRHTHAPSRADTYWRQRRLFLAVRDGAVADAFHAEETVCSLLHEVLASAYGVSTPAPPERGHRRLDLADDARRFIARHFSGPFSLGELATRLGCSPFHLCRSFRQGTGLTIHAYRDALRLRASLERVEAGMNLTAVALDLGYSSHSHFTERFRRAFGVPPSRASVARLRQARIR